MKKNDLISFYNNKAEKKIIKKEEIMPLIYFMILWIFFAMQMSGADIEGFIKAILAAL